MTDEARANLEAMGETRVRHALSQGLLVSHLIQPAHEWLDELAARVAADAKKKKGA